MIVMNHEPRIFHLGDNLTLMPGTNTPDADEWAAVKRDIPAVQHLLDEEVLEERAVNVDQIGKLAPRAAIKLVKATVVEELLLRMQKAEKRSDVQAAISAQLKAIAPTPRKADDGEGEQGESENSGEGEGGEESGSEGEQTPAAEKPKRSRKRSAPAAESPAEG